MVRQLAIIPALLALLTAAAAAQTRSIVETASAAGNFDTLLKAAKAAGLVETLSGPGPFTVFAPTDGAFAALPKGALADLLKPENRQRLKAVLMLHVVVGETRSDSALRTLDTVGGQRLRFDRSEGRLRVSAAANATPSNVLTADLACANGVIHVIDRVLLPQEQDIIALAAENGSVKTLLAAIDAAGLTDALRGDGPFTLLAPTDAAFASLPPGTVERLLRSENRDELAAILKYHVVPGRVYADQALAARSAATLLGAPVGISFREASLRVNDANVFTADLQARNGVIHVIDAVLLPPGPQTGGIDADVRRLLTTAIERGAPLFNAGNAAACAAAYETAAESLLLLGDGRLSSASQAALRSALQAARDSHSDSDRAWALRNAFDALLAGEDAPQRKPAARSGRH